MTTIRNIVSDFIEAYDPHRSPGTVVEELISKLEVLAASPAAPVGALDLGPIEDRLKKITPGEWKFDGERDRPLFVDKDTSIVWVPWVFEGEAELDIEKADGEFIANAPADIAALVAEVKRLREENFAIFDKTVKAMCWMCDKGNEVEVGRYVDEDNRKVWVHHLPDESLPNWSCLASPIRRLMDTNSAD